jgi:lysophospholipase L1-like esterase
MPISNPNTPYLQVDVDARASKWQDSGKTVPAVAEGNPIAVIEDAGPNNLALTGNVSLHIINRSGTAYPSYSTHYNGAGITVAADSHVNQYDSTKSGLFISAVGESNGLLWQSGGGPGSSTATYLYDNIGYSQSVQSYGVNRNVDGSRVNVAAIMREPTGSIGATIGGIGVAGLSRITVYGNDAKPVRRYVQGPYGQDGVNWIIQGSGATKIHSSKMFVWDQSTQTPLTHSQIATEMKFIAQEFGDDVNVASITYNDQIRIFYRGDSRTEGTQLGVGTYPNQVAPVVDNTFGAAVRHYTNGVYGQTSGEELQRIHQIIGNGTSALPSQLATGAGACNIFVYWIGVNDMRSSYGDVSQGVWDNVKAWSVKVRAACAAQNAPYRIILCTEIQAYSGYADNTTLKAFTAKVRAEAISGGYADAVADLDADTIMGDPNTFNPQGVAVGGVVYAADGLHPSKEGYARLASIIAPIVVAQANDVISGTPSPVADPVFSPSAGPFSSTQSVTITTATSGAAIRYTLDGTTPTNSMGMLYTGAISVSATATLKAIAYKNGVADSNVVTATYTITVTPPGDYTLSEITDAITDVLAALGYTSNRAAKLDNLDTAVTSRLATTTYTAPSSTSSIASAVWANSTRTLTSGGSGGSGGVSVVTGPFSLSAEVGGSVDGKLSAYAGDVVPLLVTLRSDSGDLISYTAGTISAQITDQAGAVIASNLIIESVAPAYGIVKVTVPLAARGTYRLTVRKDASQNDITTFGAIVITVSNR